MPQMAPLWWEELYLLFTISFMMMNFFIYHYKQYKMTKQQKSFLPEQLKWKW
uniref:ATP synthase F0 subunit 8 n=1 Tax=Scaptocoris castanea TaxID=1411909 RepID=A0A343YVQ7_9HEMI|nr:ATP synthase F0 subunit 8 [Scaptocoris castanea]